MTLATATAAPSEYVFEAIGIEKTYVDGQAQALREIGTRPGATDGAIASKGSIGCVAICIASLKSAS